MLTSPIWDNEQCWKVRVKVKSPQLPTLPEFNCVPLYSSFTFNSWSLSFPFVFLLGCCFAMSMATFLMERCKVG